MRVRTFQGANEAVHAAIFRWLCIDKTQKDFFCLFWCITWWSSQLHFHRNHFPRESSGAYLLLWPLLCFYSSLKLFFNSIFLRAPNYFLQLCEIPGEFFSFLDLRAWQSSLIYIISFLVLGLRSLDNFGNQRIFFNWIFFRIQLGSCFRKIKVDLMLA